MKLKELLFAIGFMFALAVVLLALVTNVVRLNREVAELHTAQTAPSAVVTAISQCWNGTIWTPCKEADASSGGGAIDGAPFSVNDDGATEAYIVWRAKAKQCTALRLPIDRTLTVPVSASIRITASVCHDLGLIR